MTNYFLKLFIFLIPIALFSQVKDTTVYSDHSKSYFRTEAELNQKILSKKKLRPYFENDTLFILFRKNESSYKKVYKKNPEEKDSIIRYVIGLNDSSSIAFEHLKYLNYDAFELKKPSHVTTRNRSFLRKNKRQLLKSTFFSNAKSSKVSSRLRILDLILARKKIFYIIDEEEFKNDCIVFRQVNFIWSSNKYFMTTM